MDSGNFVNALIYVYKLCLGDFHTENFTGENQGIIWIVFFAGTFILQITFLNMLIAIMGDTFDMVMEQKAEFSMKERIEILSDFKILIDWFKIDR